MSACVTWRSLFWAAKARKHVMQLWFLHDIKDCHGTYIHELERYEFHALYEQEWSWKVRNFVWSVRYVTWNGPNTRNRILYGRPISMGFSRVIIMTMTPSQLLFMHECQARPHFWFHDFTMITSMTMSLTLVKSSSTITVKAMHKFQFSNFLCTSARTTFLKNAIIFGDAECGCGRGKVSVMCAKFGSTECSMTHA